MENWVRTYHLEKLEVQHHFQVEAVSLTARPLPQFAPYLKDLEAQRRALLRVYRQRGYLVEKDATLLVTFCNVSLYHLIAMEVLPALGYADLSAMRHELARENIPVDYCVLIECPTKPPQPWNHLKHSRYRPEQVFWRRSVPASAVQGGVVSVFTYAVPLVWVDPEVVYPYPIYGCLTGVGERVGEVLRHAIYCRYLDDTLNAVR